MASETNELTYQHFLTFVNLNKTLIKDCGLLQVKAVLNFWILIYKNSLLHSSYFVRKAFKRHLSIRSTNATVHIHLVFLEQKNLLGKFEFLWIFSIFPPIVWYFCCSVTKWFSKFFFFNDKHLDVDVLSKIQFFIHCIPFFALKAFSNLIISHRFHWNGLEEAHKSFKNNEINKMETNKNYTCTYLASLWFVGIMTECVISPVKRCKALCLELSSLYFIGLKFYRWSQVIQSIRVYLDACHSKNDYLGVCL